MQPIKLIAATLVPFIKYLMLGIAIVFVIAAAVFIFDYARVLYLEYPVKDFCSAEDEVYRTIVADLDRWIETMRQSLVTNELGWGSIEFSVPSGRSYVVTSYNPNSIRSQLLIVLKHNWNERLGFMGYYYSTWGDPGLGDNYDVRYLANDIYCYERKPGYD